MLFDCMNTLLSLNTQTLPTMAWHGKTIVSTAPLVHTYLQQQRPSITVAQVHEAARHAWQFSQATHGKSHREVPAQRRFEKMLEYLHWITDIEKNARRIKTIHMECVTGAFCLPKRRKQALQKLRQHFGLGLLSNFDDATALQKRLEGLRIAHWFNPCMVSEAIGVRKPGLHAFVQALKAANLEPAKVLFIGDSWEEDVQGASKAGMDAVWVNANKQPTPTQGLRPVWVVQDIADLVNLLLNE